MPTHSTTPKTIDEYIARQPDATQPILEKMRQTIRQAAPNAEERINYAIPAFHLNGKYLVYFSAAKKHVGLYGAPRGNPEFDADLTPFKAGRGTLQFSYDKPLPVALIRKIIKFRVKESNAQAKEKAKKKSAKPSR